MAVDKFKTCPYKLNMLPYAIYRAHTHYLFRGRRMSNIFKKVRLHLAPDKGDRQFHQTGLLQRPP